MAALLGSETPPSEVADAFHCDGFVVLRDVLSEAFVRAARERAERNFAECRATIASDDQSITLSALPPLLGPEAIAGRVRRVRADARACGGEVELRDL